jgi:uncharacterized protein (TIGR03067 family)
MSARLPLAALLLALCAGAAAAFAPAPFPRPAARRGDPEQISVPTFQGTWRVAGMMYSSKDGKHRPYVDWHISHVKVENRMWAFLDRNGGSTRYTITIDNDRRPAHLDFWNGEPHGGAAPGGGIIRRKGDLVEIIYVFGGNKRPVSFEQPPDGQYVLTLRRES